MDRFTTKIGDKIYFAKGKYGDTTLCAEMEISDIRECMKKLANYEDTGLEPEDIPTVISENEQLKIEIARLNLKIYQHLKEKEASEVTSHSEKNILNGAISLMETVFRYMIDYMNYMGFEYDNDDDEEKPRFEMSNFEIVQRLFLSRTSHSGCTSTRAKCKELGVEDDVMINFEWSEEE